MKRDRNFTVWIAWCALLASTGLLAVKPSLASTIVKFEQRSNHLIIVPVFLNGQGPFDFMLDTGSNTTLVQLQLGRELGLRAIDRSVITTAVNSQVVLRSRLRNLTLGAQSVEELEVLFTDLNEIRSLNPRIRGVLGQNFLSKFNYILNNRARQIEFEEDHELEKQLLGPHLEVELNEGKILVIVSQKSPGKRALRFVLDAGASAPVVFEKASRKPDLHIVYDDNMWVTAYTSAGSGFVRSGILPSIHIGSQTLLNLPVAIISNRTANEERIEDGLLPTSLFDSIYFNDKERFVILNPQFPK